MLDNVDGLADAAAAGTRGFGTIDAWLAFKLTGPRGDRLLERLAHAALQHPRPALGPRAVRRCSAFQSARSPKPSPSAQVYGETRPDAFFGAEVPWRASRATSRQRSSGRPATGAGLGKNTYGTGSFLLLNTGRRATAASAGLVTTVAWGLGGRRDYALEASIFVTGAAIQWLRDGLGIISSAAETEAMAASLDSNDGVYFVPALTGLGLPPLGPVRARNDRRAHPRQRARAPRPSRARGDRLPDPRRRAKRWRRRRASGSTSCAPTAARSPTLADAVPGRRARQAGRGPRGRRDDGAGRRLPGRHRDRAVDRSSRSARCGARPGASSRGWSEDERERLLRGLAAGARARRAAGRAADARV